MKDKKDKAKKTSTTTVSSSSRHGKRRVPLLVVKDRKAKRHQVRIKKFQRRQKLLVNVGGNQKMVNRSTYNRFVGRAEKHVEFLRRTAEAQTAGGSGGPCAGPDTELDQFLDVCVDIAANTSQEIDRLREAGRSK